MEVILYACLKQNCKSFPFDLLNNQKFILSLSIFSCFHFNLEDIDQ